MIKHIVLAGNYREYQIWCRRYLIPLKEAMFVAEVPNLRGLSPDLPWHVTGSFLERRDAQEIVDYGKAIGAKAPRYDPLSDIEDQR